PHVRWQGATGRRNRWCSCGEGWRGQVQLGESDQPGMTLDAESRLNLQGDEDAVAVFLRENGGLRFRDVSAPGVYWLVMRPVSQPEEKYHARLEWESY